MIKKKLLSWSISVKHYAIRNIVHKTELRGTGKPIFCIHGAQFLTSQHSLQCIYLQEGGGHSRIALRYAVKSLFPTVCISLDIIIVQFDTHKNMKHG